MWRAQVHDFAFRSASAAGRPTSRACSWCAFCGFSSHELNFERPVVGATHARAPDARLALAWRRCTWAAGLLCPLFAIVAFLAAKTGLSVPWDKLGGLLK
jgi:hypothetical protein